MQFLSVPTVLFTDIKGNTVTVKDTKEISVFQTGDTIQLQKDDSLDEIMSRSEYYGDNNEDLAWCLFEHNIADITEANFDLNKLKTLNIPVVSTI